MIPATGDTDPNAEAKPKKPREKKEPFKVSFGDRPESMKEVNARLFATSKTSINLSKSQRVGKNGKRDEHLLPDDMHFSSRQLITLFLKSRFAVCGPVVVCEVRWADGRTDQDSRSQAGHQRAWRWRGCR